MLLRIVFIIALFLASVALAAVALQVMSQSGQRAEGSAVTPVQAAEPPPVERVEVLVVTRRIARGTLLRPRDLGTLSIPRPTLPDGAILADADARAALSGALLGTSLEAGSPVLRQDILNPGDRGFLAAVLRPGHRAISVNVDLASGMAGLIWPGDGVDLILTQQRNESNVPTSRRTWGETVLTNVKVIAVDQRLSQGGDPELDGDTARRARTVTLEVTPDQAERVAVATRLGRLSLVVRAAEEEGAPLAAGIPAQRPQTVFGSDVSPALAADPESGVRLRIIQGAQDTEVTFR